MTVWVETPMSGSLTSGGLHPTDPGALRIDNTLVQAAADGSKAVVSISYNPSEIDCGLQLTNVVKSASLPSPNTILSRARIDSQRHNATFTFKATGEARHCYPLTQEECGHCRKYWTTASSVRI